MTHENRERGGPESAALSTDAPLTPEDERIAEALAVGLAPLRTARPGFQEALEQRLLDRLAEPPRPWWLRALPARTGTGPQSAGIIRMPRRSFLGLAAASALVLAGASISLPLVGIPEVNAREILEKVQANSENPGLSGVKSFHLTAKVWSDPSRLGKEHAQRPGPREVMTEQWFVAPDRMRTESRANDSSGKTVVSGTMSNGSDFKHYVTEGATDAHMISIFTAPIGAKPITVARGEGDVREVRPAASPSASTKWPPVHRRSGSGSPRRRQPVRRARESPSPGLRRSPTVAAMGRTSTSTSSSSGRAAPSRSGPARRRSPAARSSRSRTISAPACQPTPRPS